MGNKILKKIDKKILYYTKDRAYFLIRYACQFSSYELFS